MNDLWQLWGWLAWLVSIVLFAVLAIDFFRVNARTDEDVLLSSRENYDELLVPGNTGGH